MASEPWRYETDQEVDRIALGSSQVYAGTSAYNEFPKVHAVSAEDGSVTWTEQISSASTVRQLLATDDVVYAQTEYEQYGGDISVWLRAFDPTTGMEHWSFDRRRRSVDGPLMTEVAVHDGDAYVAAVDEEYDDTYHVYIPTESLRGQLEGCPASPPRPGETYQSGEWIAVGVEGTDAPVSYFAGRDPDILDQVFEDYGPFMMSLAEGTGRALQWDDEVLYVGTDNHVYAFEPGAADDRVMEISADSVQSFRVTDETLFALTDGGLIAIDVEGVGEPDGATRLWTAGEYTVKDVAISPETVYLSMGSRLYAVDAETGDGEWVFEGDSTIRCVEEVIGGRLYAAAGETLYAVDADDGTVLAEATVEGRSNQSPPPAFADGTLYLGTDEGISAVVPRERGGRVEFDTPATSETEPAETSDQTADESSSGPTCPECGADLDGDENFCPECGHDLAPECPECGTGLDGDENFCPECGHDLSE